MSIATSLDKLSETLTNCKTNLKEKGVEAETIKISDVDEKIAEIQAGGGKRNVPITINSVQWGNTVVPENSKSFIVNSEQDTITVNFEKNDQSRLGHLFVGTYDNGYSTWDSFEIQKINSRETSVKFQNMQTNYDNGTSIVIGYLDFDPKLYEEEPPTAYSEFLWISYVVYSEE